MNKMNKKILIAVLCIAIGCVMLFATAFASSAGVSGYDAYKAALKSTAVVKSLTANVNLAIKDNGSDLLTSELVAKGNRDGSCIGSVAGTVSASGVSKSIEAYGQDGKVIVKSSDSDVYNIMENDQAINQNMMREHSIKDPDAEKAAETVIDALVGSYKDYFTLSDGPDGGSIVSFSISGGQIPAVVNALVSLGAKHSSTGPAMGTELEQRGMPTFIQDFKGIETPKLIDNVRIDSLGFKADIDANGIITNQTVNLKWSGKDAAGSEHAITAEFDISLSGIGSTSPDTVNLEGKQTKTIETGKFDRRN